jgi:hypothetical protein
MPSLLDKEGYVLLRDKETVLHVGYGIVVLGLDQHIIVLAQINDPPIRGVTASEEADFKGS